MKQKHVILSAIATTLICALSAPAAHAGEPAPEGATPAEQRRYFVGSSMFMLANFVPLEDPPVFYQLNAGYRLTPRDSLSIEAMTWRYYRPLGIPYGGSWDTAEDAYPGHVREYGLGLAYQRFLWEGLYSSLSAVPFWRQYYDAEGDSVGDGFQLFLTLRLGYHFRVLDRVFIEPSVAFTAWPVSTHVPEGFAAQDRKWPSYFLFEPGLHVGFEI